MLYTKSKLHHIVLLYHIVSLYPVVLFSNLVWQLVVCVFFLPSFLLPSSHFSFFAYIKKEPPFPCLFPFPLCLLFSFFLSAFSRTYYNSSCFFVDSVNHVLTYRQTLVFRLFLQCCFLFSEHSKIDLFHIFLLVFYVIFYFLSLLVFHAFPFFLFIAKLHKHIILHFFSCFCQSFFTKTS